jgi:hypothetical protein
MILSLQEYLYKQSFHELSVYQHPRPKFLSVVLLSPQPRIEVSHLVSNPIYKSAIPKPVIISFHFYSPFIMAVPAGLEPAYDSLEDCCLILLDYGTKIYKHTLSVFIISVKKEIGISTTGNPKSFNDLHHR